MSICKCTVHIIIIFFLLTSFSLAEEAKPNMIGIGAVISNASYKGVDTDILPIPVIFWEKDRFFIKGNKIGYTLLEPKNTKLDLIIKPRFMGYDDSDSDFLNGMEDRDYSIDGGMKIKYIFEDFYELEINASLVHDLLSRHKGYEISLGLAKMFKLRPLYIEPNININLLSKDLVDYYYGVRANEALATRPLYTPSNCININPSINIFLGIAKDLAIFSKGSLEIFDDKISNSPIIDEDYSLSGILGIVYLF